MTISSLPEIQSRVREICHYFDVETEIPVFLRYLSALSKGQLYFEVGTGYGCTAIVAALCSSSDVHVWTIDDGEIYLRMGQCPSIHEYAARVWKWFREYNLQKRIHFRRTSSAEMSWSLPVHVLFIDGDHGYEEVKADIEKWTPFVAVDGVALFHDYSVGDLGPGYSGVRRAVDEWMQDNDDWGEALGGGSIKAFKRLSR